MICRMKMHRLIPILLAAAAPAFASPATPADRTVLPWVEDDYTKALAEARARNVPIFAEAWAPW